MAVVNSPSSGWSRKRRCACCFRHGHVPAYVVWVADGVARPRWPQLLTILCVLSTLSDESNRSVPRWNPPDVGVPQNSRRIRRKRSGSKAASASWASYRSSSKRTSPKPPRNCAGVGRQTSGGWYSLSTDVDKLPHSLPASGNTTGLLHYDLSMQLEKWFDER